jgi:hypothetical protein
LDFLAPLTFAAHNSCESRAVLFPHPHPEPSTLSCGAHRIVAHVFEEMDWGQVFEFELGVVFLQEKSVGGCRNSLKAPSHGFPHSSSDF